MLDINIETSRTFVALDVGGKSAYYEARGVREPLAMSNG